MHLLVRRYSRSGYASPWFLRVLAVAFAALAMYAAVSADWLVFALASVMTLATLAIVPVSRRLSAGLRESQRALEEGQVHRG
jgi:hypothetical protein